MGHFGKKTRRRGIIECARRRQAGRIRPVNLQYGATTRHRSSGRGGTLSRFHFSPMLLSFPLLLLFQNSSQVGDDVTNAGRSADLDVGYFERRGNRKLQGNSCDITSEGLESS